MYKSQTRNYVPYSVMLLGWNGAQLWVQQFPQGVKNHWRMAVDSRSFPTRSPWHKRGNQSSAPDGPGATTL